MPSFVTWVNEWFNQPGTSQTPTQDRIPCYVAAALRIGDFVNSHPSKRELHDLHDLLTYLLLGWNPITAWPKPSEYTDPGAEQSSLDHWKEAREAIKTLMDFDQKKNDSCIYPILTCLTRACIARGSEDTCLFLGERITMLMLTLWLLDRSTSVPLHDLGVVRGCLDLHYTAAMHTSKTVDEEYAKANSDIMYCTWMNKQIERLIELHLPTEMLKFEVAYIGWFASLVRANKIMKFLARTEDWKTEVATRLELEVQVLREILSKSRMNCNEDQIRDGSSLHRSARLFRMFKLKPPPVKIKPVID